MHRMPLAGHTGAQAMRHCVRSVQPRAVSERCSHACTAYTNNDYLRVYAV